MGSKSSSGAKGKTHDYVLNEKERMRLNNEAPVEWETAKIVRKKHRKGTWPNVEYFETVEVIRMKKA